MLLRSSACIFHTPPPPHSFTTTPTSPLTRAHIHPAHLPFEVPSCPDWLSPTTRNRSWPWSATHKLARTHTHNPPPTPSPQCTSSSLSLPRLAPSPLSSLVDTPLLPLRTSDFAATHGRTTHSRSRGRTVAPLPRMDHAFSWASFATAATPPFCSLLPPTLPFGRPAAHRAVHDSSDETVDEHAPAQVLDMRSTYRNSHSGEHKFI